MYTGVMHLCNPATHTHTHTAADVVTGFPSGVIEIYIVSHSLYIYSTYIIIVIVMSLKSANTYGII